MNKLFFVLMVLAIVKTSFSYSKVFYFSNNGNDRTNSGLSETSPYKSIDKLNSIKLTPGDKVLFKRGGTYPGQVNLTYSGTSSAYITFDSYGKGSNPIITGAINIKNWKVYSPNIYVADVPEIGEGIKQVFINNSLMTLSRFPNSGFLTVDSSSEKSSLFATMLTQPDGYWVGANLIARMGRWVYENREVSSNEKGKINLLSPTDYDFKPGYGFFLNNKLNELDAPGEWYYDDEENKIYIMPFNNEDINNLKIEASIFNYGFNISNQKYINIYNLSIRSQGMDGILTEGCNHITIKNNTFQFNGRNGIWAGYEKGLNLRIVNNYFSDIRNNGIDIGFSNKCYIKGNTLKRIALQSGMGGSGDGMYIGIISGENTYIGFNNLDSIGYNGIHCYTGNTVEFNLVNNSCLTKDDGAGIYCYKSNRISIRNNIITNSTGNDEATTEEKLPLAHGIYIDDSSSYVRLNNNTVANADFGIFIHNGFNVTIEQNVLYNNRYAQLALQSDHMVSEEVAVTKNSIYENIFYSIHPNQLNLYLWTYKNNLIDFGMFNNNTYCNPYNSSIIKTIYAPNYPDGTLQKTHLYEFRDWQNNFQNDLNSRLITPQLGSYYDIQTESESLITNGTFESSWDDWYYWGSSNYSINVESSHDSIPNNVFKSEFLNSDLNSNGYYANGHFSIEEGKKYKLSFKAKSSQTSNLHFEISQNDYPYKIATDQFHDFLLKDGQTNIDHVFSCYSSYSNGRIQFYSTVYDSTIWMDDVKLTEVLVDTNMSMPTTKSRLIINPTANVKTFPILGNYVDLNGSPTKQLVVVPAFSSRIYIYSDSINNPSNLRQSTRINNFSNHSELTIYSIPAEQGEKIIIEFADATEHEVVYSILDMKGNEIINQLVIQNDFNQIDISTTNLIPGIYLLKIMMGSSVKSSKIIIE
jgi:parallel beta-helix repeat protein